VGGITLTWKNNSIFRRNWVSGGEGDKAQNQAQRKGEELHFIGDVVAYVVGACLDFLRRPLLRASCERTGRIGGIYNSQVSRPTAGACSM